MGVPGIVQANQLKPRAIVLDVGVSRAVDGITGKATLRGTSPRTQRRWRVGSHLTPEVSDP